MTIKDLWTRPHVARQMLAYHLDQDNHLAPRPIAVIKAIVEWLDGELNLTGKRICDLGCGPGLYSSEMAQRGAIVTGVDFSPTSIAYAESQVSTSDRGIDYLLADYLNDDLTDSVFPQISGQLIIEERLMVGFWSESDHVGIHRTWVYEGQALSLDHYAIVEPTDHWQILNGMQYFSPGRLVRELEEAGYSIRSLSVGLTRSGLTVRDESTVSLEAVGEGTPDDPRVVRG